MNGPGAGVEGRPATVLVFEYVTGGGLAGRELPPSWAAEGAAMRRAIVEDFAAMPGVRVVTTVDSRVPFDPPRGVDARVVSGRDETFASIAAEVDFTLVIAPETGGFLARMSRIFEGPDGRLLGSSPLAVLMTGDKFTFATHLARRGISTPPTRWIDLGSAEFPDDWPGPVVVKPRVGAGSSDTFVVRGRRCPLWVPCDRSFVAQPYLAGRPMSASFLVDTEGRPTLLAVGRQEIEVDESGRISYRGGTIPSSPGGCPAVVLDAVESVVAYLPKPSLRGFVGVDFLLDDRGEATILEINPRPTTSFVGLARLFPPGTIAGAWLAAVAGPLEATDWPARLRLATDVPAVSFDADGTVRSRPGEDE